MKCTSCGHDNPLGQNDELTPIIVVRRLGE